MRRLRKAQFISFVFWRARRRGRDFFDFGLFPICSHCVPIKFPRLFPTGSQLVPQVFNVCPKMFPIAPPFHPTLFGHVQLPCMNIACKGWGQREV
jgi:hypothetical protein